MSNEWNIKDDEIRIIGSDRQPQDDRRQSRKIERIIVLTLTVLAVLLTITLIVFLVGKDRSDADEPGLFESGDSLNVVKPDERECIKPFGDYYDTTGLSYTELIQKTINDIPLSIYIPHNATPELCLRAPDYKDKNIILATQAADIRRDNKKIVGAFVLKGTPLAWGLSKKGYCSIIDGKLSIGVADNSPLFEEATEKEGYFFRQYPLVENKRLIENEPKNKSIRKALCERAGEIFVVKSETPESFHDFAQALVDLGVNNAIYLVGSASYGFRHDENGNVEEFSEQRVSKYKYESYILWKSNKDN